MNRSPSFFWILLAAWLAAGPTFAADEGVHVSLIEDEDSDEAILMESEWISMRLLPWRQALISNFIFRPTGNDIVEPTNPKHRMGGGGGLLMDCFWEQDWRFQELAYKQYRYQITKNGPDEAQVAFETDITGWLGQDNSGIISKLLSNLTLRRTVTLKRGQPFFRFDFEFINNDRWAKRPTFWVHNNGKIVRGDGKDTVVRPTERGLAAIGGDQESYAGPQGVQFISDFNHGWSAQLSDTRREGLVYLMDYDYVDRLYNCFIDHGISGTLEWWYDSILALHDRPWRGRVYILPVIGLSRVDYANPYFICALHPKHDEGRLTIEYELTSSYESAAQVTLNTTVEYDLLQEKHQRLELRPVTIDGLAIQPNRGRVEAELNADDPLLFNVTAFVELPDGKVETYRFQSFYTGQYRLKGNQRLDGSPVVKLDRPVHSPHVPEAPAGLQINRQAFNVFQIAGLGTIRFRVEEALGLIPNSKLETGYCTGNDSAQNGLTDFPYDYERLFDQRVLLFSDIQDREIRRIGASILMPWLKAGGGLVILGGEFAFSYEYEEHPINSYYPFVPKTHSVVRGPVRLQAPAVADHPIFRGIDCSDLPWLHYYHDVELKDPATTRVLMKAGDHPFLVERRVGDQITVAVTVNPFGAESEFDGKPNVRNWPQWSKLLANIVRYAGQDLK